MQALEVWKTVTKDSSNFLDNLIALLAKHEIRYCVIGGQGVNAYVEPLISLDLDLVVAVSQLELVESLLGQNFKVERFPNGLNVSAAGSNLRVQIQTDPRYLEFADRAAVRNVLGLPLPVARVEDILQGKVWAATSPERRPSKRRKDLLDIERLLEAYPKLRDHVPAGIRDQLAET
jgi:hypothetical protein